MALVQTRHSDLSGEPDAVEQAFALDGREFVIDLTEEEVANLHSELRQFIEAARTAKRGAFERPIRRATSHPGGVAKAPGMAVLGAPAKVTKKRDFTRADSRAARRWAAKTGRNVPATGRVAQAVMDAWVADGCPQ